MHPPFPALPDLLYRAANAHGTSVALADRWRSSTYAELLAMAERFAGDLSRLGVGAEDRIAVVVEKRIEVVAAIWGTYLAGAVLVPVNPQLKARQITHILLDSGARLLVAEPSRLAVMGDIDTADAALGGLAADGSCLATAIGAGSAIPDEFSGKGLANLFYTSGSTGLPKAVACTHDNISAGAESVASYIGNVSDDVILAILPLSFDAGFSQLTTSMSVGARVILQDFLLPNDISKACETHKVTGITGVPAIWAAAMRARWSDEARARIRYFANTGGHLAYERQLDLRNLFPNARPYPMYGLTEAFRSTYLDPAMNDAKPGSIGKAIPGATVLVVNEAGEDTEPGEAGELIHAGPTVALGYWKNADETARRYRPSPPAMMRRGIGGMVVYSGDVAIRDADGFIYYKGRRDSLVKISGNRISFAEIEEAAMGMKGVLACAAGAVSASEPGADPSLVLFVETLLTDKPRFAAELRDHLKRELPGYAVPARIDVRDDLPLNQNNKYDVKRLIAELV
jgi:acyl-CoA synthetase (AMP-forming)/AMP-acid ligase II